MTSYLDNTLSRILEDRFFEAVELDLVESGKHPAKYQPPCRHSIYKTYVTHMAENKSLVVDDLVMYKMKVPRVTAELNDYDDDF